jgi:hypothetical protein
MRTLTILTAILGLSGSPIAGAQSSRDFAVMGRSVWSAFECSSLASTMRNPNEQERLFQLGYKNGLAFIAAIQAQKIEREHITEEVPIGVMFLLEGPTPDFILGRIYEAAQGDAHNGVDLLGAANVQKTQAQGRYDKQNCRLLGDAR